MDFTIFLWFTHGFSHFPMVFPMDFPIFLWFFQWIFPFSYGFSNGFVLWFQAETTIKNHAEEADRSMVGFSAKGVSVEPEENSESGARDETLVYETIGSGY